MNSESDWSRRLESQALQEINTKGNWFRDCFIVSLILINLLINLGFFTDFFFQIKTWVTAVCKSIGFSRCPSIISRRCGFLVGFVCPRVKLPNSE